MALFGASAVMTSQDRERLDGLLAAVERQQQAGARRRHRSRHVLAAVSADESDEIEVALRPFAAAIP